ncbi:MAG: FAD/FMN-containing dehydrogenase, partial [Chthonomonadales bacterium]|nr:FAD/FMN-containing dehydrogenase [Chthonomonadales bacterium]
MSTLEITSESDALPVPEEAAEADQPTIPVEPTADPIAPADAPPAPVAALVDLMPHDHLERVEAWGMNTAVVSYVYRPTTLDGIYAAFEVARKHKLTVGLRGAGRSYGDASLSAENICLDLTRMNRILDWDPQSGIISIEPGVTLRQLWQYIIEDGWWPPVVSGTMTVTMGGALGMNYHGKNNYKMGPIGDHTLEFDLMLPSGEVMTCSRAQNADIFFAA